MSPSAASHSTVLVVLLVVAVFRPLATGTLTLMSVLAAALGAALAARRGVAPGAEILTGPGRMALAVLFCTAGITAMHALVSHAARKRNPGLARSPEPKV